MEVETCNLADVLVLTPRRFPDARGFFCETWNRERMVELGVEIDFVQDNQSFSAESGTFRGFHFQKPPHAQAKLIRVARGAVLDVVVDIRRGSGTYGQHFGVELSAENGRQIYVPVGLAHSFLTLQPDSEVLYKTSDYYAPESEGGLRYDDPALGIDWPMPQNDFLLNDRDRGWPDLASLDDAF